MARKSFVLVVTGALILFLASIASADVPHMMSYSGNVTKIHGGPLNGTFQLTFSIYPDTSGSPADWTETQPEVVVKHGLFSVLLGSVNPIPPSAFDGSIKYLGVQVESDPEMRPLTPIVSVAYAYRAGDADIDCEDCDYRFVNDEGPDSIIASTQKPTLKVNNYSSLGTAIWAQAPFHGLYVKEAGSAIYVDSAEYGSYVNRATLAGLYVGRAYHGVQIDRAKAHGVSIESAYDDGVHVSYAGGHGLRVVESDSHAIVIDSASGTGLKIGSVNWDGVEIRRARNNGIDIWSTSEGSGLVIHNSAGSGVVVGNARFKGIRARGEEGGGVLYSLSDSHYGLTVNSNGESPTNPGLYVAGTAHSTGGWSKSVQGSSGNVTAFGVSSPNVELIASGTGTLINGQAQINFPAEFQEAISTQIPVKVVFAAQGAPSGLLYVESKSNRGFTVQRLQIPDLAMKSDDITFDWIAIGRQKGHEETPKVLIPSDEEMRAEQQIH